VAGRGIIPFRAQPVQFTFAVVAIIALSVPSLVYVVEWVYEDSGLRSYDSAGTNMDAPGSTLVSLMTVVVGISAFLRLVEQLGGNSLTDIRYAIGPVLSLLSPFF